MKTKSDMVLKTAILFVAAALGGAMQAWAVEPVAPRVAPTGDGGRAVTSTNDVPKITWPAALAPAYREFEAKCAAGTATRGDLISLKRFIAASAVDGASKTNLTREVRRVYQRGRKRVESRSRK